MHVGVLGAGPVGVLCAGVLARRGHEVLLVDRDPGPPLDGGPWERQGVMQFLHPHYWRMQVRQVLLELLPEAWDALVDAGGVPVLPDGMPEDITALACRRWVVETALRRFIATEPGVTVRAGFVEDVLVDHGRVVGIRVEGTQVDTDVVVDTTGRSGRLGETSRPPVEGGPCGYSYVSRMYQARPGAPLPGPLPVGQLYDGYQAIVFPQDARTLSALLVRPTADERLAAMRHDDGWAVLTQHVPHLTPWTDPDRYDPITPVLPGGGLTNTYRRQCDDDHPAIPGLLFVGDTVCTTNPAAGRGVALGFLQARAILAMLDGPDTVEAAGRFDAWCTEHLRPWYDDHVLTDRQGLQWWLGESPDPEGPISSGTVLAAADHDPSLMPYVGPFLGMLAGPSSLGPAVDRTRELLRAGWRPAFAEGPSVATLTDALATASL